jgi:hypothetical protein
LELRDLATQLAAGISLLSAVFIICFVIDKRLKS